MKATLFNEEDASKKSRKKEFPVGNIVRKRQARDYYAQNDAFPTMYLFSEFGSFRFDSRVFPTTSFPTKNYANHSPRCLPRLAFSNISFATRNNSFQRGEIRSPRAIFRFSDRPIG